MNYYDIFSKHLNKIKKGSKGNYQALCPFHDDKNPSFSFNIEKGLFKCFGCGEKGNAYQFLEKLGYSKEEILKELGIESNNKPKLNKSIEELKKKYNKHTVYFYQDFLSNLLYKKHRFENPKDKNEPRKTFYIEWLVPEDKRKVLLYNLPDLRKNRKTIFVAEGEKCVEKLKEAVKKETLSASVIGYNNPKVEFKNSFFLKEVSDIFYMKDIYVFADNDEAGEKKAKDFTECVQSYARNIYLVNFSDKENGFDIADWLGKGKTLKEAINQYSEIIKERRIKAINLSKLANEELQQIEYITSFKFPVGKLSLVAGLKDSGKSILSIYISLELLEKGKNVAFISLEDDILDYERRFQHLYSKNPINQKGKLILENFEEGDITKVIEEYLKNGIDFVFIDPVGSLFEDENSNSIVQPIMKKLNFLCNKYQKNIVLLHHLNKETTKSKLYSDKTELWKIIRGATAIQNNARHILFLRRKKEDENVLEVLTINNNFGKKPDFEVYNLLDFDNKEPIEIVPLNINKIKKQKKVVLKDKDKPFPF